MGLQRHQLRSAELELRLVIFDGQAVDFFNHAVIASGQALNLHLVFRKGIPAFFRLKPAHFNIQLLKWTCKNLGNKKRHQHRQAYENQHKGNRHIRNHCDFLVQLAAHDHFDAFPALMAGFRHHRVVKNAFHFARGNSNAQIAHRKLSADFL